MKLPATGDGSASALLRPLQRPRGSALSFLLNLFFPTSLLVCLLVLLAACNGLLCITTEPMPSFRPSPARFQIRESMPRSPVLAVREEEPLPKLQTQQELQFLQDGGDGAPRYNFSAAPRSKWSSRMAKAIHRLLRTNERVKQFASRADEFLNGSSSNPSSRPPCKVRFFMTWISALESFGERELFVVESLFKSQPDACLLILSNTMNSASGERLLGPFLERGFRVSAMSPDYAYLFKKTPAEPWFKRLKKGGIHPGEVPLGQNLSNLLRLAVLYKFGGVYIDTDVIVLKSFSSLQNVIGAQTLDLATGNWSRLNNAVMVFDREHPLLYKFIQEFALTFDGNKWGHNGPYLVSRVAARVSGRPEFQFTVLPPSAFYPVDWSRISGLFHAPRQETDPRWFSEKLRRIQEGSFAVHLWNRQSRKFQGWSPYHQQFEPWGGHSSLAIRPSLDQ
ncbi:hypothetical protein Taro_023508 [Colocasia esculenta]|uniref:Alpha 1,4-glycosyltransferase domain-containing protein n=1 Tax=Colocasia esculenta TaxID=4460 RepID=A0A843V3Z8_COLES|nr:hypothetical protein [Colocasia esculenta]